MRAPTWQVNTGELQEPLLTSGCTDLSKEHTDYAHSSRHENQPLDEDRGHSNEPDLCTCEIRSSGTPFRAVFLCRHRVCLGSRLFYAVLLRACQKEPGRLLFVLPPLQPFRAHPTLISSKNSHLMVQCGSAIAKNRLSGTFFQLYQ